MNLKEVINSMQVKFRQYEELVRGMAEGRIRHLIVAGPAGMGKTYEAERAVAPYVQKGAVRFNKSAGHVTPLALYNMLYSYRRPRDLSLFDDCDSIFQNDQSLNLLKAYTDTRDNRVVSWGTTNRQAVVQSYSFAGSLIVLTNRNLKLDKFRPLLDRVLYFDLDLTPDERVARILWVLRHRAMHEHCKDEVGQWIVEQADRLGDRLTIRTAIKALELAAYNRDKWRELAESTIVAGT